MATKTCNKGHIYDSYLFEDNCPFCCKSVNKQHTVKSVYVDIEFLLYQIQRSVCCEWRYSNDKRLANYGTNQNCPTCHENLIKQFQDYQKLETESEIRIKWQLEVVETLHNSFKAKYYDPDFIDHQECVWELDLCQAMIVLSTIAKLPAEKYVRLKEEIIARHKDKDEGHGKLEFIQVCWKR